MNFPHEKLTSTTFKNTQASALEQVLIMDLKIHFGVLLMNKIKLLNFFIIGVN